MAVKNALSRDSVPRSDPKFPSGNRGAQAFTEDACRVREVLERVGDKWSMYVVCLLGSGTKRFSELRREIGAVSPRMLTVTVRSLERDGLVSRTVFPVIPPRVEYSLTPMGRTLLEAVVPLVEWASEHLAAIEEARTRYDAQTASGELAEPVLAEAD